MDDIRLWELLEKDLDGQLTICETDELLGELRTSASARNAYWDAMEQHVLTGAILSENRGRDLARLETGEPTTVPAMSPARPRLRWSRAGLLGASLAALACVLIAAVWWNQPEERTPLATIQAISGDAEVCDASGLSVAATEGVGLFLGQVLRVGGEESRVEVLFADGTQMSLQSGSALRFSPSEKNGGQHVHLENGALQVRTAHEHKDVPFIVSTDHTRIAASDTSFRVYREEKASRVELEKGEARLEGMKGTKAVAVAEGSFVVATDDPEPMVVRPLADANCRLRHTFFRAGDAVAFSPDGSRIATSHFHKGGLKVRNVLSGAIVADAAGTRQRSLGLAFAMDDTVVGICDDGAAMLWKVGDSQATLTRLRDKDLRTAAISGDGRWIAQATRSEVAVWDVDPEKGSILHRHSFEARPSRVAISSVGPQTVVSSWGGEIVVLDSVIGRETTKHKLSRTPTPLTISADNRFLAAYASDDGLVLFDEQTGMKNTLWAGRGTRVNHLVFSGDSRIVLAGLDDGTVRAWSADDGRSLLVLDTGYRSVNQVTMSADRTLLATVGDNDCVKIWECTLR